MPKTTLRKKGKGDGGDFVDLVKTADKAKNEKMKATTGRKKLPESEANNRKKNILKPSGNIKRTGRSKGS